MAAEEFIAPFDLADQYDFVPAAKQGAQYHNQLYGAPIYSDALVSFFKREQTTGRKVYLENEPVDAVGHIWSLLHTGIPAAKCIQEYGVYEICDNIKGLFQENVLSMTAWLSAADVMQKYYLVESRGIDIQFPDPILTSSKVVAVNATSPEKDKAFEVIQYLLRDEVQLKMLKAKTALPVLTKHYIDPSICDACPYITEVSYKNFSTFPLRTDYEEKQHRLWILLDSDRMEQEELTEALAFLN